MSKESINIDTHVHTHYSPDSLTPVETAMQTAAQQGLDSIAITDHTSIKAHTELDLEQLYRKYGLIPFPPSVEVTTRVITLTSRPRTPHVLLYNIELDEYIRFMKHYNLLYPPPLQALLEWTSSQEGIVVVAPHPTTHYSFTCLNQQELIEHASYFHGVETINSRIGTQTPWRQQHAREYGLPEFAGSDAHTPDKIGIVFTRLTHDSSQSQPVTNSISRPNTSTQTTKASLNGTFQHKHAPIEALQILSLIGKKRLNNSFLGALIKKIAN